MSAPMSFSDPVVGLRRRSPQKGDTVFGTDLCLAKNFSQVRSAVLTEMQTKQTDSQNDKQQT